ncbi:MAG: hypothetical protein RIK87_15775 [Fuerstiella sp.]
MKFFRKSTTAFVVLSECDGGSDIGSDGGRGSGGGSSSVRFEAAPEPRVGPHRVLPAHRWAAGRFRTAVPSLLMLSLLLPMLGLNTLTAADKLTAANRGTMSNKDLTVGVRFIGQTAAATAPTMETPPALDADAPPQPVTPAGKLPQYQLDHRQRSSGATTGHEERVRFLLALPDRLALVELRVTVDGRPFRQLRQDRVTRLMTLAAAPRSRPTEVASEVASEDASEAAAEAATKDATEDARDTTTGNTTTGNTTTEAAALPAEPVVAVIETAVQEAGQIFSDVVDDALAAIAESAGEEVSSADDNEKSEAGTDPRPDQKDNEDGDENSDEGSDSAADSSEDLIPEFRAASTVSEWIARYMAATGEPPSVEEIHWLLTNWVDGPTVLFLNDNFQRFRADQAPVFRVLDRDRDGQVSAKELQMAVTSFRECDLNRDDVVEATELAEVATDPRDEPRHAGPGKLIVPLSDDFGDDAAWRHLVARYEASSDSGGSRLPRFDTDQNGTLDAEEIHRLQAAATDLQVTISFNLADPAASRLSITGISEALTAVVDSAMTGERKVTLKTAAARLEFSALQTAGSDQLSIGAVNDGYPLLPVVDPNNDGRFTIRELRQLTQILATFDDNQDGRLTAEEIRPTIRVCVGLGPVVHDELAALRQVRSADETSEVTGPEWFVRMDVNRDRDLTRREFPGTDEQFAALDTDNDKLISAVEATLVGAADEQ